MYCSTSEGFTLKNKTVISKGTENVSTVLGSSENRTQDSLLVRQALPYKSTEFSKFSLFFKYKHKLINGSPQVLPQEALLSMLFLPGSNQGPSMCKADVYGMHDNITQWNHKVHANVELAFLKLACDWTLQANFQLLSSNLPFLLSGLPASN